MKPFRRVATSHSVGRRDTSSGQSLVEMALVVPLLLVLVLGAIDFGRVYLGWINSQQMARIAANFAANNATDLDATPDAAVVTEYQRLVANDARAINCTLPDPLPMPQFTSGTDLGDPAQVQIPCRFQILTPVISSILGGEVLTGASAVFPVKQGAVTDVATGTPVQPPPIAQFLATPQSGYTPLTVEFFDISENQPTSWIWTFGDGTNSFDRNPVHIYSTPGTYTVTLTVANSGGSGATLTRTAYIEAQEPPTEGPIAEFAADPVVGSIPMVVQFTDMSTGDPVEWLWDFGDGSTATTQNPSHTYTVAGTYDVSLTVTTAAPDALSNTQIKRGLVLASQFPCIVPNFANEKANDAQAIWSTAGFTTTVIKLRNGNFTINYQSIPGGLVSPPNGCAASIRVGP